MVVKVMSRESIKKQKLMPNFSDFDFLKITLLSPEQIRAISYGEVKKPETINYRTFRYERDGLFCERIFGPAKDYRCSCGKYSLGKRFKGKRKIPEKYGICDRCGVDITSSSVRRMRIGHIELQTPVAHIWFLRKQPSKIGTLLGLDLATLERIVYCVDYVVVEDLKDKNNKVVIEELDGKKVPITSGTVLVQKEYFFKLKEKYRDALKAETGAEAIRKLLEKIDLKKESERLRDELQKQKGKQKSIEIVRKLRLVEDLLNAGIRPEWMVLTVLPVIPPDLRPIVELESGKFAASDLNDLYRRIIYRNNRLREMIQKKAPEVMINNEKRMLQCAVDALFETASQSTQLIGAGVKKLRSLTDIIKGKQGRFRQNLLGKRVDYSGRSVITVNPELKLTECGLFREMALELFKPFIMHELLKDASMSILTVEKMINRCTPQVYEILEKVVDKYPVLLNRAPTLHRMSIQGFYVKLIPEKVIQIPPLVCVGYNADFDGDQMAVHVPITPQAIAEVKLSMMAPYNSLSPASGQPILQFSQDIIMGCVYLTKEKKGEKGEGKIFSSFDEVIYAYNIGEVDLHARIKVANINKIIEPDLEKDEIYDVNKWKDYTTVGRVIFNQYIPEPVRKIVGGDRKFINSEMNKKVLNELIEICFNECGTYRTYQFLDDVKEIGFHYATISGLTMSLSDALIIEQKKELIKMAYEKVAEIERQVKEGLITESERYNAILDVWINTTEKIAALTFKEMRKIEELPFSKDKPHFNALYLISTSGARGNPQQVRQLSSMRGLMAKPQRRITGAIGEIIETPITSNFKEGLSMLEYFLSTHGGRKGLVDTALKTADAGYLTRKLVVVAHNVYITTEDCGTLRGMKVSELKSGDEVLETLAERITGRVALQNIVTLDGEILVEEGEIITADKAKRITDAGITELQIRSVLTCEDDYGVCAKCYGVDLSTNKLVNIGTPVGIIAAQSIGEPGTQLTLRTFHIGGAASKLKYKSEIIADEDAIFELHDAKTVKNRNGEEVLLTRSARIALKSLATGQRKFYQPPYGAIIKVKENQKISARTVVAEWDPYGLPIIAEYDGIIRYGDIIDGKTVKFHKSKVTRRVEKIIVPTRGEKLTPRLELIDAHTKRVLKRYLLPVETVVICEDEEKVCAGDVLAKIPQEIVKVVDITGGLPRATELFEARHPKNKAIISEIEGTVSLFTTPDGLPVVKIVPERGKSVEYQIPRGRHLIVYEGDRVMPGEPLTDGVIDPHDIAKVGKQLPEFLVNEIQKIYRSQGVCINIKHIEVMVRRMLSNVRVTDPGSSLLLPGTIIPYTKFQEERKKLEMMKKKIAIEKGKHEAAKIKLPEAEVVLCGITEVALSSESFMSAAAFQETSKVLIDATCSGEIDYLRGLKENIIVSKYIPVGTTQPMLLKLFKPETEPVEEVPVK